MAQLTRDELHDLVWSVPGTVLAKRFGISDVGLGKICARHEIPRPSRGYWAKKKARQRVHRIPLPALSPEERELRTVTILGAWTKPVKTREAEGSGTSSVPEAPEENVRIIVPETLSDSHHLLRTAAARKNSRRKTRKSVRKELQESLCRKCYSRALRILDALFKHLDEHGHPVERAQYGEQFVARFDGEPVTFTLREEKKSVSRRRFRSKAHELDMWRYSRWETETIELCTKLLVFETERHGDHATKSSWKETEKWRLEDHLHECASGLARIAVIKREDRRRWEEEIRRSEEREKERKRKEEEERRLKHLQNLITGWRRARDIRAFISVFQESSAMAGLDPNAVVAFLSDAREHADRLDPLVGAPELVPPREERHVRYI